MLGWIIVAVSLLTTLLVIIDGLTFASLPVIALTPTVVAGLGFAAIAVGAALKFRRTLAMPLLIVWSAATAIWLFTGNLVPPVPGAVPDTVSGAVSGVFAATAHPAASAYEPASVRLRKSPSGTFIARGEVNGTPAAFLVDTGAKTVVLRSSDAETAGIDVSRAIFNTPVETAAGTFYAAPVRIRTAAIGPLRINDLEALVAKPGSLNESLLGMNFLTRLSSYDISGDFLTLRQ